jgi:hypothetical protein
LIKGVDMVNRREMLHNSVIAASALILMPLSRLAYGIDYNEPVEESKGLTAYQKDNRILVRYNNLPMMSYRSGSDNKYPYFYPLAGPKSGLSLTTESALPYPHHRGLWMACDPLNGGNYWADNGLEFGQIKSRKLVLITPEKGGNSVTITQKCEWKREGSHPFNDERSHKIIRQSDDLVFIDCDFKLTAMEDVTINKAKHSFFAMRAASDISPAYGGTLLNSDGGIGYEGTYGKTADWCGYFGKRRQRPDVIEGIIIMNHPDNFGGKCPWLTRNYGHLSPSPFNFRKTTTTFPKGKTFRLNYRVVLFAGTPKERNMDGIFKSWLNG